MAAEKKTAKNNKTAHVLNLLTDPNAKAEGAPAPAQSTESPEASAQAAPARPLTPPILEVARSNDEHLSEQIRLALEEDFPSAPTAEVPAIEEPAAEPVETAPESAAIPEEDDAPDEAEVAAIPEAHTHSRTPSGEEITYFNVMQTLVEEKAPRYIEMFGLCPCRRCATDVKALALNHLEPKYVTMRRADLIPMLTVYESRYSASIFAQLTHACKMVMDNPRHEDADFKQD